MMPCYRSWTQNLSSQLQCHRCWESFNTLTRMFGGRAGRLALADLRELGHTSPTKVLLEESQLQAFEILRQRLCSGRPKTFLADVVEKPVLIFTDGALEYEGEVAKATIGGVCLRPGGDCEIFGAAVPDQVVEAWQRWRKDSCDWPCWIVCPALSRSCIGSLMYHRDELSCSSTTGPRLTSLVKGTSLQPEWRDLLLLLWGSLGRLTSCCWLPLCAVGL